MKKQKQILIDIKDNPSVVQGLVSLTDRGDHIYMHLVESAKFNFGKNKIYFGVPGNLVAFACNISFDKEYEGYLAFDAKTVLVKHYQETLFATHFKGTKMMIERRFNAGVTPLSFLFKTGKDHVLKYRCNQQVNILVG